MPVSGPKPIDEWLDVRLRHFVLRLSKPFDTRSVERVLKASRA